MTHEEFQQKVVDLMTEADAAGLVTNFILLYRSPNTTSTHTISDAPEGGAIALALSSWVTAYLRNDGEVEREGTFLNGQRTVDA